MEKVSKNLNKNIILNGKHEKYKVYHENKSIKLGIQSSMVNLEALSHTKARF